MTRAAWVVVDLGFGDAGKGATTDFLVRDRGAALVVRANGGAQAGHNVVTPEGRHHTFTQWGAGTFVAGVRTLLGPAFALHPGALAVEARVLGMGDAWERLLVDARATVISPFQQAANRIRELARAESAHGTCGVGVGEAVGDALAYPEDALRAADLGDLRRLRRRLASQQERKWAEAPATDDERARAERDLLEDPDAVERVLAQWAPVARRLRVVDAEDVIASAERVVFEGAQGVLLDEAWGFLPHRTWSDCTPRTPLALLAEAAPGAEVTVLGVVRSYATRHGPGPFPSWDPEWDDLLPEPHNDERGWQGAFRRGPLDLVLLRYAVEASGGVDGLVVNHLDRYPGSLAVAYQERCEPGPEAAAALARARPVVEAAPWEAIGERLGLDVLLEGWGPTAAHRRWRV